MKKPDDMPMWVFLAFSSIETREVALMLVYACVTFSLYCVPWGLYFGSSHWVSRVFLIGDWSWFAMMVPTTMWYWLSLQWMDRHSRWPVAD